MQVTQSHFIERRKKLFQLMNNGIAFISAADFQTRSNDTEYPFRQNSDFYYLSGFGEDNAVLVLKKDDEGEKGYLFIEEIDLEHALWNGSRLGIEEAKKRFKTLEILPYSSFESELPELLKNQTSLYIDLFDDGSDVMAVRSAAKKLRTSRAVKQSVQQMIDVTQLIRKIRLIKTDEEIAQIKKAIAITAQAHHEAMRICRPGMKEYELQAKMNYIFASMGAKSEAYGAIVAGGNNANTLHYIQNDAELDDGSLVLIDAACEWELYASDITRTFPVNGQFTPAQKALYEKVLDVQLRVIDMMRPGVRRDELQKQSERWLAEILIEFGILKGDLEEVLEAKMHKKYAPHGIGHWMGLDVHDPCPYADEEGESITLQPGMVMTIEPGIYICRDDTDVEEKYRGIGIRIEDDILITADGCENLSSMIAKSVEEIERTCSQG